MRKSLMFAGALALAAGTGQAQTSKPLNMKPPPTPPAAAADKPPAPEPPKTDPDIQRIVDGFFATLKAGQAAKAYDDVWRGTPMDRKAADVAAMVAQTTAALQLYGRIDGWEPVKEEAVAPSFRIHTYMVRAEVGPLFFRFQFYRKPEGWTVYRLDFADQIGRLP